MMFRETPHGTIAIPQPSHAWISGQIIRAWGNAVFGSVTPYEDVCLGAEQHDIGWLGWEQAPTLNSASGRPHSFRDVPVAAHTAIWSEGTSMALALGRYPALLVSLHGTALYASYDLDAATPEDAAIVRAFLRGQQAVQRGLIESLAADGRFEAFSGAAMIERNRRLVRTADRMSIAICVGMRDPAIRSDDPDVGLVRQVPTADGETDLRLTVIGKDLSKIGVSPWPFGAPAIQVACEGYVLPPRLFTHENEMREALRGAKRVAVTAELRPG